jgi:hypothetical protein
MNDEKIKKNKILSSSFISLYRFYRFVCCRPQESLFFALTTISWRIFQAIC